MSLLGAQLECRISVRRNTLAVCYCLFYAVVNKLATTEVLDFHCIEG